MKPFFFLLKQNHLCFLHSLVPLSHAYVIIYSCSFAHLIFFFKAKWRRRCKGRERERDFHSLVLIPNGYKLGLDQISIWVKGFPSNTWRILYCFPRHISRVLDWKCGSQDFNWHLRGMPTSHMAAHNAGPMFTVFLVNSENLIPVYFPPNLCS